MIRLMDRPNLVPLQRDLVLLESLLDEEAYCHFASDLIVEKEKMLDPYPSL
ncbi:hypothetical protein [Streptococcus thermophilus]|uniref:hypothetical protein n=1 Tax=Streptococcus thermophilus TaxID=1308 RepID=UPI0021A36C63|nr:hypothetical protein [Streptococcus thermophilus]